MSYTWAVEEASGLQVASGSAPTYEDAAREANRYAAQYAEDGPVRWWIKHGRKLMLRGASGGRKGSLAAAGADALATFHALDRALFGGEGR